MFRGEDVSTPGSEEFPVAPRTLGLGAVTLTVLPSSAVSERRSPPPAGRPGPASYHVALHSGELAIHDSSMAWAAATGREGCFLAHVRLPKALLPLPRERADRLVGRRLPAGEGIAALVANVLVALASDSRPPRPADAARLGTVVLELITALFAHELELELEDESGHPPVRGSLLPRVQGFIRSRLGDPGLCPDSVAAAHGISTRHLYKVFQEHGLTVAAWIRQSRLERCRRDLGDPAQCSRPVHAVAARWGFTDGAHFSRAFRAAYGMPPQEYRLRTHGHTDRRPCHAPRPPATPGNRPPAAPGNPPDAEWVNNRAGIANDTPARDRQARTRSTADPLHQS